MEEIQEESATIKMLHPSIRKMIEERGWNKLTEIQEISMPYVMKGYNTLIMAPTGEGKTEAALLPIVSILLNSNQEPIDVLYITPMKALINDIYKRVSWWTEKLGLKVSKKHGDTPASERSKRTKQVPNILITTPESLEIDLDWSPKFRQYYKNIKVVIVDELHELLGSKRGVQLLLLLERLRHMSRYDFQRIGLSATIGSPEKAINLLSGSSERSKRITSVDFSKEYKFEVKYIDENSEDPWKEVANELTKEIEKPSLVFVNSRYIAERVKHSLESIGAKDIFVHHSSVSAELREEAESKLKKGELSAIVCTKTLELGIDVGSVNKVIQIRSPGRVSNLIQRVGRSGHISGGLSRGSIIAIGPIDFAEALTEASLAKNGYVEDEVIEDAPIDVIAKEIIGFTLGEGPSDPSLIYNILSKSPIFKLDKKRYIELLKYMQKNGVIKEENGLIMPGNTFYKIWKFKSKDQMRAWWSRSFSEFFTTIPEKDVFVVKNGDTTIGYIDSLFVYRNLRTGDTIRLAGSSWEIKRIDDINSKIDVIKASGEAEIPLWKGEGSKRSKVISKNFLNIITDNASLSVQGDKNGLEILQKIGAIYKEKKIAFDDKKVIYEHYNDEHIFIAPLGSGVSEAIAIIMVNLASKVEGLNVYYRPSFYGFSVFIGELNPFELLKNIDPDSIETQLREALQKSPYLYQSLREAQLHLGKIGSIDEENDEFLINEISKQVLNEYFDINGVKEFLKLLKQGKIEFLNISEMEPTPLARGILEVPSVRPWIQDLAIKIGRLLDNTGLTIFEIADILELAEKTIENKLKDMRKPEYDELRVVRFIDVDEDDSRWTLLKSLESIVNSDEFKNYFTPKRINEPMRVHIRVSPQAKSKEYIITPKFLMESWNDMEKLLPEEIYEVKITSAYEYGSREDSNILHYFVNAKALKLLLLNAATYIERKQIRRYF
ncbi:MAG: DEAD/DEAH box helicase [Caldisphaera sp.]